MGDLGEGSWVNNFRVIGVIVEYVAHDFVEVVTLYFVILAKFNTITQLQQVLSEHDAGYIFVSNYSKKD